MQFFQLQENSPPLTFHDALNNRQIGIKSVSYREKRLITPKFAACPRAGSGGNGIEEYPRSKLRRL
jgi:hypothetical protein